MPRMHLEGIRRAVRTLILAALATAGCGGEDPEPPAVLLAAGDIAYCERDGDEATARILQREPGTVAALGDTAYPDGTASDFARCYDPTWGRVKARTRPALGNHEYADSPDAKPYFDYFGPAAHGPGGWYSYELGAWHVVVMNSNCDRIECGPGSPQERWLRADLERNRRRCTLAYGHHSRFSSGAVHGEAPFMEPFWEVLYEHGVEVVLSGHDHIYERFAPQTPEGRLDRRRGIRAFVVGTGGGGHYELRKRPRPNSEVRDNETYGVLRLTLRDDGYRWLFLPAGGGRFTDSGTGTCH